MYRCEILSDLYKLVLHENTTVKYRCEIQANLYNLATTRNTTVRYRCEIQSDLYLLVPLRNYIYALCCEQVKAKAHPVCTTTLEHIVDGRCDSAAKQMPADSAVPISIIISFAISDSSKSVVS